MPDKNVRPTNGRAVLASADASSIFVNDLLLDMPVHHDLGAGSRRFGHHRRRGPLHRVQVGIPSHFISGIPDTLNCIRV